MISCIVFAPSTSVSQKWAKWLGSSLWEVGHCGATQVRGGSSSGSVHWWDRDSEAEFRAPLPVRDRVPWECRPASVSVRCGSKWEEMERGHRIRPHSPTRSALVRQPSQCAILSTESYFTGKRPKEASGGCVCRLRRLPAKG